MNTMSTHRPYRLKARADRQRETRDRIVAATEELHRQVGPARTTIADIARRAGVERLTVYNHFPELAQLLGACQASFLSGHPPPDIAPGRVSRAAAPARLEQALGDLYVWFRENELMERHIHRDRLLVPELDRLHRRNADPLFDRAAAAYAALLTRSPGKAATLARLVRLAFDFRTWELVAAGGSDREAARAMRAAISPSL
jgi:AcrR family transcriptional regulator